MVSLWHNGEMARPSGIAFMLAQLGAYTSERFAARLAALDLTPAQVGVLRVVGQHPGLSQQALAERTGALPSQVVRLVDDLEDRGLLERRRSTTDRRQHELHTPQDAAERLGRILSAVRDHDAEITDVLTAAEKRTLADLLAKLAAAHQLDPEAHRSFVTRRPRTEPTRES
jgi:DNA-binding MarR family transcriptional regulator